jgi:hypothetical protein
MKENEINRRKFLKITGTTTLGLPLLGVPGSEKQGISIILNPDDKVAGSAKVQWAFKELISTLETKGVSVDKFTDLKQSPQGNLAIVTGASDSPVMSKLITVSKAVVPDFPEALGLIPLKSTGRNVLLVCGKDERGLIYALLELVDRVNYAAGPLAALNVQKPVIEKPANEIRSINRLFVSDVEDKPWFYDKEMWPKYLTMLATQRFNRFNLSLGIGHDLLQNVVDAYFIFAYPFLMSVPGYKVRVPQLPDEERDKNLETLRFISEQTVARGMQFQLGLWMHGYEWLNSPNPNYTIEGVTKENHGPYCRDAIRELLKACPAISGVTLRVHGESGVNEGSYDFWKMVFEGIATCGRKVEIDLHPKGTDQTMIDLAVNTGMPVVISPKYWAEHLGLPYHQADIRDLEIPKGEVKTPELLKLSLGSRMFTRYGIADLLKENRPYKVVHRIWPGTQRILLWGDPGTAAAYSRAFSFCGSAGMDLMEPLSFKGRRGSGIAGDRCAYKDKSLKPRWDWEKYLYTLRVWGRMQYNPNTESDVWMRFLNKQFGPSASYTENALANASRILPVVLTAHGTSAANNAYWPEMYTNLSITNPEAKNPYFDTPTPKVFGNVSSFDPQLFLSINDFVKELIARNRSGKYTPIEAAQWIEDYAEEAEKNLNKCRAETKNKQNTEYRRMETDVSMQIGLGRFFAAKLRSGVLYAIFEQSGERKALEEALNLYKQARDHWSAVANIAKAIYLPDVTVGERTFLRGHWLDRLPAIDEDISLMAKNLEQLLTKSASIDEQVNKAIALALGRPNRIKISARHSQPVQFKAGQPVELKLSFDNLPKSARLYYKHVNHGERYQVSEMRVDGPVYTAEIPGDYTNSEYPLEYYFELRVNAESACLFPGFNQKLDNQPYFIIRKASVS